MAEGSATRSRCDLPCIIIATCSMCATNPHIACHVSATLPCTQHTLQVATVPPMAFGRVCSMQLHAAAACSMQLRAWQHGSMAAIHRAVLFDAPSTGCHVQQHAAIPIARSHPSSLPRVDRTRCHRVDVRHCSPWLVRCTMHHCSDPEASTAHLPDVYTHALSMFEP